jgi:hypothetical protein
MHSRSHLDHHLTTSRRHHEALVVAWDVAVLSSSHSRTLQWFPLHTTKSLETRHSRDTSTYTAEGGPNSRLHPFRHSRVVIGRCRSVVTPVDICHSQSLAAAHRLTLAYLGIWYLAGLQGMAYKIWYRWHCMHRLIHHRHTGQTVKRQCNPVETGTHVVGLPRFSVALLRHTVPSPLLADETPLHRPG